MQLAKPLIFLLTLFLGLVASTTVVRAALVQIGSDGNFVVNVLSITRSEDIDFSESEGIEVKRLINNETSSSSRIALTNNNGNMELTVEDGVDKKVLDISTYEEDVLEIEERPKVNRLSIRVQDGKFILEQDGVVVSTEYNLNIDPKTATLSVSTPTGHKFLTILPKSAADSVVNARILSKIYEIDLRETSVGILSYDIQGHKDINIFNLINYEAPINAHVAVSTGEVIFVERPKWLEILGFLFA